MGAYEVKSVMGTYEVKSVMGVAQVSFPVPTAGYIRAVCKSGWKTTRCRLTRRAVVFAP